EVHNRGRKGLYEVPAGYPFAGRILTGATTAIAYSDDRAADFTASVVPDNGAPSGADAFVALPPGSSHPGRVLAAGRWGVTLSGDGGQTFTGGGPHEILLYLGEGVAVVEGVDGGAVALAGVLVGGTGLHRAWS